MKTLLLSVGLLFGLYVCVVIGLFAFQRHLIFFPDPTRYSPEDVGLAGVEEIALTSSKGGRLYSWFARADPEGGALLLTHGNGGNIAYRADKLRLFREQGYSVLIVGYPGYGGSQGSPSETGLVEAGMLGYDYLRAEGFQSSDIVLYGESIGSAVAIQIAAQKEVRALVLEAPMSSVRDIASSQYPFVPVKRLLKHPFLSVEHIHRVQSPILFIHGDADNVVPLHSGKKLFAAANETKHFHVVKGGGHNNLYDFPIVPVVMKFLDDHP